MSLSFEDERVYYEDYLTGAKQKIPDWLVKITFLGKAETTTKLGIKSWFSDKGLGQVTPFGAVGSYTHTHTHTHTQSAGFKF